MQKITVLQIEEEKVKPAMKEITVLQIEEEKVNPAANDNAIACCSEECMAQCQEFQEMPQMSTLERLAEYHTG